MRRKKPLKADGTKYKDTKESKTSRQTKKTKWRKREDGQINKGRKEGRKEEEE
jgi:hypothetical protein